MLNYYNRGNKKEKEQEKEVRKIFSDFSFFIKTSHKRPRLLTQDFDVPEDACTKTMN